MTERYYTVSAEPPKTTFGKTYVRIPYDVREEEPREDMILPEGMHEFSYCEVKLTYPEYTATLATTEDVQISAAETLATVYEMNYEEMEA